jgi:polyisoprenoid-binding protein YceI
VRTVNRLMSEVIQASFVFMAALSLNALADEPSPQPRSDSAERYTIDSARTVVSFEVHSFGAFRQRGRFVRSSGRVSMDPRADEGMFDVLIDARSVQAANGAELRILRGAGFLDVEEFPEISYKARHVMFFDGEPIRVEGALTLLGVSHAVPLTVSSYHCAESADGPPRRCMLDATAMFRRSWFGMTGSVPFAGDRVRLVIHAEATAEPSAQQPPGDAAGGT